MSQGPSTLGSMTTSSLSPTAPTISITSSSAQGELSALMRVHSPVAPKSIALAMSMKPARAAPLASTGMASSRLPSTTSTWRASSGTLARIFSRCGGTKWIMRSSRTGSSRKGRGRADGQRGEELAGQLHGSGSFQKVSLPFRGMQRPRQVGAGKRSHAAPLVAGISLA